MVRRRDRLVRYDAGRLADCGCIIGNIRQYHRHRADPAAIADMEFPQNLGVGAKIDVIAQYRRSFSFATVADSYALSQGAVLADNSRAINENASEMPDAQAFSDGARFRQAYASHRLGHPEQKPVTKKKHAFADARGTPVHPSAEPVHPDRP